MLTVFFPCLLRTIKRTAQHASLRLATFCPTAPSRFVLQRSFGTMQSDRGRFNRGSGKPMRKKRKESGKRKKEGGTEEVLLIDVEKLLKQEPRNLEAENNGAEEIPPTVLRTPKSQEFPETEVAVTELSSTGDGLALSPAGDHVYVVPFTVPGDTVRVKVCNSMEKQSYSETDLVEVVKPSSERDNSHINCQYFGRCSGCQLQMMSYQDQLQHKKGVVAKAYTNFSGILRELIPPIGDTVGSPLQFGYRTKLTPHFSLPHARERSPHREGSLEVPPIGFNIKGQRKVLDIEDCPLGTDIVRRGLQNERERVHTNLAQYKRGATLLVRETTDRKSKTASNSGDSKDPNEGDDLMRNECPDYIEEKRYVTQADTRTKEYVDDYTFHTSAGSFFQNNNSILSPFIAYIRANVFPPASTGTTDASDPSPTSPSSQSTSQLATRPKLKYLLDAYCGSGLFTISLANLFLSSLGVDVDVQGINSARANALSNHVPNAGFTAADAAALFSDVPYPPDQTLLVIDPPRKGCDQTFMNQMFEYGPARVIYVSCNVHTQARDVGLMVQGAKGSKYEIESIRGFDFFPQTGHVESVAVLNKVHGSEETKESS